MMKENNILRKSFISCTATHQVSRRKKWEKIVRQIWAHGLKAKYPRVLKWHIAHMGKLGMERYSTFNFIVVLIEVKIFAFHANLVHVPLWPTSNQDIKIWLLEDDYPYIWQFLRNFQDTARFLARVMNFQSARTWNSLHSKKFLKIHFY